MVNVTTKITTKTNTVNVVNMKGQALGRNTRGLGQAMPRTPCYGHPPCCTTKILWGGSSLFFCAMQNAFTELTRVRMSSSHSVQRCQVCILLAVHCCPWLAVRLSSMTAPSSPITKRHPSNGTHLDCSCSKVRFGLLIVILHVAFTCTRYQLRYWLCPDGGDGPVLRSLLSRVLRLQASWFMVDLNQFILA